MFEHSLKNAYIGEVYDYSYDFRNKTTANLTADWFSVYEWTWKVNSSWLSSNSSNARVIVNKSIQSLLNATKLTITQLCILSNGSVWIRLNWTWRTYATWMYMGTTENYQTLAIAGTANNYSWMSAWTYTQTAIFDFVNKTATLSCTWKSDHTETMTDTQINNIKNNINNIEFYIDRNSSYIQTVNIIVCY